MSGIRNLIENWFKKLAAIIFDHRYKTLIIMAAIVAVFFSQLPKITVDTSTEGFLNNDDPSLLEYETFRDQFGQDQVIIIALKPETVFDFEFLKKLKDLHEDLNASLPYLDEITSLLNARSTRGRENELIVEDLLEKWPQNTEQLNKIRDRALANPLYRNMLLSEDGKFTTIIIRTQAYTSEGIEQELSGFEDDFDDKQSGEIDSIKAEASKKYLTDEENGEVVAAVEAVLKRHHFMNTQIFTAGPPFFTDFLKRSMMKDIRKFMAVAVITIMIFLIIIFRRLSGMLMPLLIVILSLMSTVGVMAFFGKALKLPTQILPSFILAVGVGDSVHILVIFFRHLNKHGNKKEAIEHALGHSGLAVLMTSLTTAGGLLSFSTAAVAPVADLGVFASIGVMLAFLYTIILLPAMLAIFPIKPLKHKMREGVPEDSKSFFERLLSSIGRVSIRHPYPVLFCSFLIIFISFLGILKIYFSHNPLQWLPSYSQVRIANENIDKELRGSTSLEVIIDTGRENGLYDPGILKRLEKSIQHFEKYKAGDIFVGKAWSLSTILKEINQALHSDESQFYTIPDDKKLIAQEFLLFENSGSDDLEDFTDSQFSKARFIIKVPFIDAIAFTDFIEYVNDHFIKIYPEAEIHVTGIVAIFVRVITSAIMSMRNSYGYALIIITFLMILLIGRVRIGLLSMIPNIAPILVMLGIMGWLDIPMNLFTMLVGSIAIGLAVDDTIHFMHNFRRYFEASGDAEFAVMETLHTAGRAMMVTTCVLSIGFFTFMFASMNNLFDFGMLTGITLIMALMSDYFLAPALMILVNRRKK